jgi:uncharacterized protein YceK
MKLIAIILMLFLLTSCAATLTVPAPTAQITVTTQRITRDDCRRGGWQRLRRADGSAFRNQGACVSYFPRR